MLKNVSKRINKRIKKKKNWRFTPDPSKNTCLKKKNQKIAIVPTEIPRVHHLKQEEKNDT
jgi:hypothetical protein